MNWLSWQAIIIYLIIWSGIIWLFIKLFQAIKTWDNEISTMSDSILKRK